VILSKLVSGGKPAIPDGAEPVGEPTITGSTPPGAISGETAEPHAPRLHVLVISEKQVASFPLPDSGEIRIGRSPRCDVMVDDPSISRDHARLDIGPPLRLRDAGSVNGTRIRDRALAPGETVDVMPGEAIQIGTATMIVQRLSAPIRPRRLWTHDYFEVRLEEECARSARTGTPFAVVRLTASSSTPTASLQDTLTTLVRLSDVVGEYGPSEYELLLVDTGPDELKQAVQRIVAALHDQGVSVRVGTAAYPRDGRTPYELMSRAGATVRGAPPVETLKERAVVIVDRTMEELYRLAQRIAGGTITVLILGETGVGKEVLAEHVHMSSPRAGKPYLKLNCAALSETLLESELFGHQRGAFTGAVAAKPGLLETADGGTVFLDEVGELPLSTQVKLLRVIEERMLLRVGGLKPRPIDVRFIAATNRDLEAAVARGEFRQDLFFRLNGATLVIPPLRERVGEIPALARSFLAQAARQAGLAEKPALSPAAVAILTRYTWPGNLRELRNVIERAVLLSGNGPILPAHLPLEKMRATLGDASLTPEPLPPEPLPLPPEPAPEPLGPEPTVPVSASATSARPSVLRRGARLSLDEEREQIEAALAACGGNQTRAAKMLGIARRTLINRMLEFGLARPRG